MKRNWPKNTITALNVALGALFAYVAVGPISEILSDQPVSGIHLTYEAAALFGAASAAFFVGAWALFKTWPKMWAWQVVPAVAAVGMTLLLTFEV